MENKLIKVGNISGKLSNYVPLGLGYNIFCSKGLKKHVQKRHPDCLKYMNIIPDIISAPDYIGRNPREEANSIEMIKRLDNNVLIGIKLDIAGGYYYVATLHTITDAKLNNGLNSGRLTKY